MFLVIMAGVHVPTPVSTFLREPFGYSSAAEGFIFLSACLAGMVYGRAYGKSGWPAMSRRVWDRARLVYVVHLAVLLPLALTAWVYAGQIVPYANHFHDFLLRPWGSLPLLPLLLHQPPLFDILPLYVVLLLVTPYLFVGARRRGWGTVLALSALGWLAGQLQVAHLSENSARLLPLRGGSFNLPAWQFLWTAGLALGETSLRGAVIPQKFRAGLGGLAAVVVLAGFCARHEIFFGPWFNPDSCPLTDKWTLGPLRLLNFAAWVALLLAWNPRPPARLMASAALLGRHSLAVFAFHLPVVITATALIQIFVLSSPVQTLIGLTVIGSLFVWARWLENNARKRARLDARRDGAGEPLSWFQRLQHMELIRRRPLKSSLPA
jgi:hypothetical protein